MARTGNKKRHEFGDLYKLLDGMFPQYRSIRDQVLDVPRLASRLGMTSEGVYKWLRADKLPTTKARKLVEIANEGGDEANAAFSDFLPFLA